MTDQRRRSIPARSRNNESENPVIADSPIAGAVVIAAPDPQSTHERIEFYSGKAPSIRMFRR